VEIKTRKFEIKSKGFYFSFDAMIALAFVIGIMILLTNFELTSNPIEKEINKYTELNSLGEDALQLMTYQKISEAFTKSQTDCFINNSVLTENDLNLSIIDSLAILWAAGNATLAQNLTQLYLEQLMPSNTNYRVLISDEDGQTVIYTSSEVDNESKITVARRLISGVKRSVPRTGYVAKVSLTEVNKMDTKFGYFGGYVGDGNITQNLSLENMNNVFEAQIELDASNPFKVYINNNFAGAFIPIEGNLSSSDFLICNETFNPDYCNYFSDQNLIEFKFENFPAYIGGGLIKIKYNSTQNISLEETSYKIKYAKLPGIKGVINLFSSFYVPGTLNSIEAYLHYKSNYTTFMSIGNATIFEKNASGVNETIYLNNDQIIGNLTQDNISINVLSGNTIPIRVGFKNISSSIERIGADVILVTDVSGSMEWCTNGQTGSQQCTDWYDDSDHLRGQRWGVTGCEKKIDVAKAAGKIFVNSILNNSGNQMGMVDYTNDYGGCAQMWSWYYCYVCEYPNSCGWNSYNPGCVIPFSDSIARTVNLTENNLTLQAAVDSTETWWGTCTCCGVNKAIEMLKEQSDETKFRGIVLMSDGEANKACAEQGSGNSKQDAILAAQAACDQNISVYTIGFGADADETTLKAMACNDSMYYNASNVEQLAEIYQNIGTSIKDASYSAQTIEFSGNFSTNNVLYSDSYLKFNYTSYSSSGFGEISLTQETEKFGGIIESPKNFSFTLPNNTEVKELMVTSYSSNFWTDRILVKNQTTQEYNYTYKLWDFGENYQILGDPFVIQIPVNTLVSGENEIQVDTATEKDTTQGGSPDDKVIYTLLIKGYVPYGNAFERAEGSTRIFESELGNFTIQVGNYEDIWDPNNDSLDDAVQRLISSLDTDNNSIIDVKLSSSNIKTDSIAIGKIPWMWGPAEIRLEVWG